ncbi:MAG: hypothetical protein IMY72_12175 [Bacteroidetes bacterium]|nr:hypothetical protein [Bacteroidota bacterium]
MIYKQLLSHQLKFIKRNPFFGKKLIESISIWIGIVLLLINLVAFSFFADKILIKIIPEKEPIYIINSIILYYFGIDFLLRFFSYNVPYINIFPYLTLKIKKSKIIKYLLIKSQFNIYNLFGITLFLPYSIKTITYTYGIVNSLSFIIGILLTLFINNYISVLWKLLSQKKYFYKLIPPLFIISMLILENHNILSIRQLSNTFSYSLINDNFIIFIFLTTILVTLFKINEIILLKNLYIGKTKNKNKTINTFKVPHSFYFKNTWQFIILEIKMILRNKKSKNNLFQIILCYIFALLIFSITPQKSNNTFFFFCGYSFLSAIFMFGHGIYLLTWESTYFDGLITKKINIRTYLLSKYHLFLYSSVILSLIAILFLFLANFDIIIFVSFSLFNIGVTSLIVIYFATFNNDRATLNKNLFFNYEGYGVWQYLLFVFEILLPVIIYKILIITFDELTAKLIISSLGIVFICSNKFWINLIAKSFKNKKYKILSGYKGI